MNKVLTKMVLATVIVMGLFIQSCSEKSPKPDAANTVNVYGVSVDKSSIGDKLNIFIYPDYLPQELVDKFQQTYGVTVVIDYFDNNDALLAKMQAGGAGQYDIVCPSDYAVTIMKNLNLLQKIDHANIPNLVNLDTKFHNLPYDMNNEYTVAYQWGTTGLGIRSDLVDVTGKNVDTWDIVFDPAKSLGAFTMLDDSRETIGTALKYLGYSLNTTSETELRAAEKLLLAQRKRVMA